MTDKLNEKIREAEEEHAGEVLDTRLEAHRDAQKMRAMFVLGGINIAGRVAASLDSEAITSLILFQQQKLHEALGYLKFDVFLNESEYSPMTKAQFYERKALLEKEGEAMFNLLTELGLSIRKRKLLGKGNVEMSGDTLIVHDGDESTEIQINDRAAVLEALSTLADANAEKSIKLDRQQQKIDKHDQQLADKNAEINKIRASKIADIAGQPHAVARVELGLAFRRLTEAAGDLSPADKDEFRDAVLEDVAAWSNLLRYAYRTDGTEKPVEPAIDGESFDEALETFLDTVDLDDVTNNDGELAAQL